MRRFVAIFSCVIVWGGLAKPVHAQIISQWNFNTPLPGDGNTATGVTTPSIGAGTLAVIGGVTSIFSNGDANGGSTDPQIGDDSGLQTTTYPAQGVGNLTAGVQFNVNTTGFNNISVLFDVRHSNTSSRFLQFQYSTDGSLFTNFGALFDQNAGDTWFNANFLTSLVGADDNANFAFRIVTAFDPMTGNSYAPSNTGSTYAGTGTLRFDMVTVTGTAIPEPTSMALAGLGIAGFGLRRLRRSR